MAVAPDSSSFGELDTDSNVGGIKKQGNASLSSVPPSVIKESLCPGVRWSQTPSSLKVVFEVDGARAVRAEAALLNEDEECFSGDSSETGEAQAACGGTALIVWIETHAGRLYSRHLPLFGPVRLPLPQPVSTPLDVRFSLTKLTHKTWPRLLRKANSYNIKVDWDGFCDPDASEEEHDLMENDFFDQSASEWGSGMSFSDSDGEENGGENECAEEGFGEGEFAGEGLGETECPEQGFGETECHEQGFGETGCYEEGFEENVCEGESFNGRNTGEQLNEGGCTGKGLTKASVPETG